MLLRRSETQECGHCCVRTEWRIVKTRQYLNIACQASFDKQSVEVLDGILLIIFHFHVNKRVSIISSESFCFNRMFGSIGYKVSIKVWQAGKLQKLRSSLIS